VFIVTVIDECPRRFITASAGAPSAINSAA